LPGSFMVSVLNLPPTGLYGIADKAKDGSAIQF